MPTKINFPFMLNRVPPFRNFFFIYTFLKWFAFLPIGWLSSLRLRIIVSVLSLLLIVAVDRKTESIVEGWYLRSWCQNVLLFIFGWFVIVFNWLWFCEAITFMNIRDFRVFSHFLRILFTFRTQIIRIWVPCMFHCASVSLMIAWFMTLSMVMLVLFLH